MEKTPMGAYTQGDFGLFRDGESWRRLLFSGQEGPMQRIAESLTEKMQSLTSEQLAEVEEFVESLQGWEESRALSRAAATLSEPAFAAVWSNPEDDVYDAL
jgi:hypothetical protein